MGDRESHFAVGIAGVGCQRWNRQAPVCLVRPSRPRTYRTVTSGANPRKQGSDEIRWAQFECTNRSRDVRRWAFTEPAEKSLPTNSTNDTNGFAAAQLASVDNVNGQVRGELA